MSIIDNETFLPGVITEVESDYSYGYDSSLFGTTDSVLLIGTAFNGPTGVPVEIYSPEHGRYVFGKAYDAKAKQEATLVAAIEDAYQRGCRTIYAIRISGKQIEKAFDLAIDTNLKLKVSSLYPTNEAKDFFMVYDDTTGDEKIKLYKPAARATIMEKMQGLVESDNSVLVTEIRINRDYGMTKDSNLVDLMRIVNDHQYNNILRLTIVDERGRDVTNSSMEAQSLPIGALFPGAYFIGRDESLVQTDTDIDYVLVENNESKPFSSFEGILFKRININTDVSAALPIYAKDQGTLRNVLREVEVFTAIPYDFLETQGLVDNAFAKDKVDYEEVDLSDFEIYKRLGSGFAITARAERRGVQNGNELPPRVKEAKVGDPNRVHSINDGIYSMLENLNTRYRVLTCGNADTVISGRLPKPKDFLVTTPISVDILNGLITATPVIEEDNKFSAKKYKFQFTDLDKTSEAQLEDIYLAKVMKVVPQVDKDMDYKQSPSVPKGTLLMEIGMTPEEGTLKRFDGKAFNTTHSETLLGDLFIADGKIYKGEAQNNSVIFKKVTIQEDTEIVNEEEVKVYKYENKKFVLGENNGKVFAFKVIGNGIDGPMVEPLGDINTMLSENIDKAIIYAQSNHFEENPIIVKSRIFDGITLEEFVEMLNNHEALKGLFEFSIADSALGFKDEYITDVADKAIKTDVESGETITLAKDRKEDYNYSLYIPYKTSDSFARQLAQHCTYTSLKTAPTHGVIGVTRLTDLGLNSIANKVEDLLNLELDLYAKNVQGRNMLDRNNMPYPIGKNVSVIFTQYYVFMDDGYKYVSNGAGGYAGMVSRLPLDQSSTAQPIAVNGTLFELTNYQLTRLTQKGFVTIKQSYTRGPVITDGITMAPTASPFRRLSVTRIIGSVEELIREAVEPYIGKQNHVANRNAIQTAIKSRLDKLEGVLIEAYRFNLVVDPRIMKFSYIDIDYQIVPIYEIREVRNRITVKDEL